MDRFITKKPRLSASPTSEFLEPLCELMQEDPNSPIKPVATNGYAVNSTSPVVDIKREESSVSSFTTPTHLPEVPHQPDDVPPYYDRRRHHLFQKKWYNEYPWLHYDTESKGVYCFQCLSAVIKGGVVAPPNNIFSRGGFRNWKKGVERFRVHENSQLHKDTVDYSVSRLLGMKANCAGLEVIVSSLRFLLGIGYEVNSSSLIQLLELRRKELPVLEEHLSKTVFSPEDERELVQIMSSFTVRAVCQRIRNDRMFGINFETVCTPGGRMVSVTVRTSQMLRGREYFLGLYPIEGFTLDDLAQHLSFEDLIAFAFKSPDLSHVEKSLEERCPTALNMSPLERNLCREVQNSLGNISKLGNCLSLIKLLIQVLSDTDPEFLSSIFEDDSKELIHFRTVHSTLKHYSSITERIRELRDGPPWPLVPSMLVDILEKPETVFNLLLCKTFFYPVENLSNLLKKAESIKGIKEAVSSVADIFETYKSDEDFNVFWDKYVITCKSLGTWNEDVNTSGRISGKETYFGTLSIIDGVLKRLLNVFDGQGFVYLAALEDALISREENDDLMKAGNLLNFFNVQLENLTMEKQMLAKMMDKDGTKISLRASIKKLRLMERETTRLFPELMKLANVFVIAQISKEVNDVTTSRLGSLENFLVSTKSNELIHDLSLLYVYHDDSSILCNKAIAQAFIASDPSRLETLFKQ